MLGKQKGWSEGVWFKMRHDTSVFVPYGNQNQFKETAEAVNETTELGRLADC